jgi:hypothetical protein
MLLVGLLSLVLLSFLQGIGAFLLNVGMEQATVETLLRGDGWRLMMIAGALPALLVFFIRLFVPESHKWEAERDSGGTNYWATRDLLGVLIGAISALAVIVMWSPIFGNWVRGLAGNGAPIGALPNWATNFRLIGTLIGLVIAIVGYIYPVIRYLGRAEAANKLQPGDRSKYVGRMLLGACLAGVALLGTWGSLQWAPKWSIALAKLLPADGGPYYSKEYTQIASATGAIIGAIVAALLGGWLGRRITYFGLCLASFVSLVYLYRANDSYGLQFLVSVFAAGGITAAFYGWFPLYLPELFPTSIRATSQGFAYNFGRVLSAIGTLQMATLTHYFSQGLTADLVETQGIANAGATLAGIYLIGLFIIWLGPETKGKPLPD